MAKLNRVSRVLIGICTVGSLLLYGCAASAGPAGGEPAKTGASAPSETSVSAAPSRVAVDPDEDGAANVRELQELWEERNGNRPAEGDTSGFMLGPGDILRISLPQIDHMKDRRVRVSENDTIDLPMLGVINVAGMTQESLHAELSRRIEKYVYKPQVAVYLEHTENRVVAVLGAVKTPGRYMLASSSDTIMTMISRAGGTTEDAASRVIFIPSPSTIPGAHQVAVADSRQPRIETGANAAPGVRLASSQSPVAQPPLPPNLGEQGLIIDLFHATNERYLEMPVKMGDVIIIPVAGEVTVQGWVDKPGSYKITHGMTVLSAIAAAGGALFSSHATLLRERGNDSKMAISLDLNSLKDGTQRDIALEGGDVVVVERSAVGAVPYTAYFLINKMGWGVFPAL